MKEADSSSDSEYIDSVTVKPDKISSISQQPSKEVYAKMIVRGYPIKFHVDCGATVNVLPMKYLAGENIEPTKRTLQMWNRTELKPKGTCRLTIRNPKNDKKYSVEFMAVQENLTPLLGAKAIQRMGIVEIHNENFEQVAQVTTGIKDTTSTQSTTTVMNRIIEEFTDVFEGEVGTLEGEQHLEVDPTVQPTTAPSRRVHVMLDEESSRLTTFDTPFGRYRWKRLPFGISVASEIFQERIHQALERLAIYPM